MSPASFLSAVFFSALFEVLLHRVVSLLIDAHILVDAHLVELLHVGVPFLVDAALGNPFGVLAVDVVDGVRLEIGDKLVVFRGEVQAGQVLLLLVSSVSGEDAEQDA